MPSWAVRVAAALAITVATATLAWSTEGVGLYLHVLPFSVQADVSLHGASHLRLVLYAQDPTYLASTILGWDVGIVREDRLEVEIGRYPMRDVAPSQIHRAASFLVDFDEEPVVTVARQAAKDLGARPSREALTGFVADYITDKSLGRGNDVASQVARHRSGDCTEHAVLLAALARSFGLPSKVVHGTVIGVPSQSGAGAYGHAWTEIFDDGRWHLADAALRGPTPVFYIPSFEYVDEGPGYGIAHLERMIRGSISKIEVTGARRAVP